MGKKVAKKSYLRAGAQFDVLPLAQEEHQG